ncbi:hypothetical protein SAMN05421803_11766 [Nocardiopsis flavescens]|uniref:Uncharacterized protein n=1 Tax=Nocardiopsis flavescens TaxID=758803 RepID=A0A1M6RDQ7_9ACTN|nr:hypothetical protein SAMN05421803_11766 [Nocardiopsis flavescens]
MNHRHLRPAAWSRRTPVGFDHAAWMRRNSPLTPAQCEAQGLCVDCGGRGGLWWSFGAEYRYTPCRSCTPEGGTR